MNRKLRRRAAVAAGAVLAGAAAVTPLVLTGTAQAQSATTLNVSVDMTLDNWFNGTCARNVTAAISVDSGRRALRESCNSTDGMLDVEILGSYGMYECDGVSDDGLPVKLVASTYASNIPGSQPDPGETRVCVLPGARNLDPLFSTGNTASGTFNVNIGLT